MSLSAELGSLSSSLEEITHRIAALADELAGGSDDVVSAGLIEVERSLRSGGRRLDRLRGELRTTP